MLVLTEGDVQQLLTVRDCMDVLEDLFAEVASGGTANIRRHRMPVPGGSHQILAGSVASMRASGVKTYVTGREADIHMVVVLFDTETGRPMALVAGTVLGAIRTGAASGIATRFMARHDASVAGLIGSGFQARTQLAAIATARQITRAAVYSRSAANRDAFAEDMSVELGIPVEPVASAEDAVRDADVVCLATPSPDPVVDGAAFRAGVHINAVGSNRGDRRELDGTAIRRAARIVVDDLANAQRESGDLIWAVEHDELRWDDVVELADVVSGRVRGRPAHAAITLFESQGLGIEDVATAKYVHDRALTAGIGRRLKL